NSISGEQPWSASSVAVPSGSHTIEWRYTKDGSVSDGDDAGWVDNISIGSPNSMNVFGEGSVLIGNFVSINIDADIESPGMTWLTSEIAGWYAQSTTTIVGATALQSGNIGDDGTSTLIATIELSKEKILLFNWKASSEENFDYAKFSIDGELVGVLTGITDWETELHILDPGTHQLKWEYVKDSIVSSGEDAIWIDNLLLINSDGSSDTNNDPFLGALNIYSLLLFIFTLTTIRRIRTRNQ
ncbi:MAG: hypothetical protein KAU21_15335, partial [Gammaproteobacteria bacterium]|nr:hypothetical protein [Gammaproteobacteria bacterium]